MIHHTFEFYAFVPPQGSKYGDDSRASWRSLLLPETTYRLATIRDDMDLWPVMVADFLLTIIGQVPACEAIALVERRKDRFNDAILRGYAECINVFSLDNHAAVLLSSQLEAVAGCALVIPNDGIPYVEVCKCSKAIVRLV